MKPLRSLWATIHANLGNSIFVFVLVLSLVSWIVYTRASSDGIVTGRVVDSSGAPVAGATVLIREKTLSLIKPPVRALTDAEGVFTFHKIDMIEFLISARKEGYAASKDVHYHLYFKKQHFRVPRPLVVSRG